VAITFAVVMPVVRDGVYTVYADHDNNGDGDTDDPGEQDNGGPSPEEVAGRNGEKEIV
jgi:hypothetical protein